MFENHTTQSYSFTSYLNSRQAIWYWLIIIIEISTFALIFPLSGNIEALFYARNVLGLIFVLFLPGYALMRTPLYNNLFSKKPERSLAWIEKIAFSIALSIVMVSMITLIIYYSPFDLNQISIFSSLFLFTSILSTFTVVSEYRLGRDSIE
jgi:uncharacterized membrane protein